MGCFSFICTECGKPINSDSFSGENVRLSLLQDGKVIEEMQGQYDSYGRVFGKEKGPKDTSLTENTSIDWKKPWGGVFDLMFSNKQNTGISAAHVKCIRPDYKPVKESKDDPNQGWGTMKQRHRRDEVEIYHKVYDV